MTMYHNASLNSNENYSRSILKPEYTQWGSENPSKYHRYNEDSFLLNDESTLPQRRSHPKRQTVHPYSRYMPEFSMPNSRGSYNQPSVDQSPRQKSLEYSSAIKQRYLNMHKLNRPKMVVDSLNTKANQKAQPQRSPHNGMAEHLRRTRESNTFSLIDAQLSKAPLDRIREMYLQVKGISTSAGNAPRTTKKANLSAVHAVVRFRIRDYLLEMREHTRRLLDQVVATTHRSEDSSQRVKDLDQIYSNLTTFPCSRDCTHCERLQMRPERPRVVQVPRRLPQTRPTNQTSHRLPHSVSVSSYLAPVQVKTNYHSSISIKTDEPVNSRIQSPQIYLNTNNSVITNDSSQFSNSDVDDFMPQDELTISMNDVNFPNIISNEQKTLWSAIKPHVEPELIKMEPDEYYFDEKPLKICKRSRIDSNVSRFCQELGLSAIDWSMGMGEFESGINSGDYSIDLTQLLYECKESPIESRFSTAEDDVYSPATCDSDIAMNQDSLILGSDIPVN